MAPYSIPGGSNYATEIDKAIRGCSAFVLVSTPDVQNSIWIPKEVDRACNYKKKIMPFMLASAEYPDNLKLYLTNVHRYDATNNKASAMQELITDIRREFELYGDYAILIDKPPHTQNKPKKKSNAFRITLAALVIMFASLIVTILVMVAVKFLFFQPEPAPAEPTTQATNTTTDAVSSDFAFVLDWVEYPLPCSYSYFPNFGWTIASEEINSYTEDSVLNKKDFVEVVMFKDNQWIKLGVYNMDSTPKKLSDCTVFSIYVTDELPVDFIAMEGVKMGMTRDYITTNFYREPDKIETTEDCIEHRYILDENELCVVILTYDKTTLVCNSIYFQNIILN